jgi:CheY-like chemotaxis protein
VTAIRTAAERGGNLTRQLMLFGGRQAMDLQEIDLNEAVTEITPLLKKLLGPSIQTKVLPSPQPLICRADCKMIQQVVLVIAANAREAMATAGTFTIKLEPNAHNAFAPRASVILEDTGCGMDEEELGRVFEPFFTTREVGRGSGLGLSAAYGIIKRHEGSIQVSSQPGHGTRFEVLLPLAQLLPEESKSPVRIAPDEPVVSRRDKGRGTHCDDAVELPHKPTILLVEDEEELRSLVQVLLEGYGYCVLSAENGVAALRLWRERPVEIDLVLTDIAMPEGMTGWQLAAKLKSDQPDLRIVYTSGHSVDMIDDSCERLIEGENFVQKPYRPQTLAETLGRALASRS